MLKNVYTVKQVNAYIKNMFIQDFMLNRLYVKGEVSNCKYHPSGHIYFSLKDESGTIACAMFAGSRSGLSFRMQEGQQVVVLGSVSVYERDGRYQMYAREIILDGAGELYLKFEALKKELEEMGMFSEEYKQKIPRYIRRLGVVTAPTGAAVRDIIQIAHRRNPYVEILLYPVLVQGEGAPQSIVSGIRAMDRAGVDVMIVGRGGGSLEDLWAFNEEIVAEAVFECQTPVISAVGHEVDTVITDYVADLRAPTPSAAAELAVFDYNRFVADLGSFRAGLLQSMVGALARYREKVADCRRDLELRSPAMRLQTQKMAADQLLGRLNQKMKERLEADRRRLAIGDKLTYSMETMLRERQHELQLLAGEMEKNSPLARLAGGYGFVTGSDGRNVTSVLQLGKGEEITLRVRDGAVRAEIREIFPADFPAGSFGKKSQKNEIREKECREKERRNGD